MAVLTGRAEQPVADMSGVVAATRAAHEQARTQTADILGNIAADMRATRSEVARGMSGVAAAMRSAAASGDAATADAGGRASTADSFYSSDVTYSTYGTDARKDIANSSSATYTNPFIMANYAPGVTYAAPGGRQYINLGGGTSQAPIAGRLTSGFGYRPSFGRMHRGVDLSLNTGDTVRAAFSGTVVLVSTDPKGYGRYVKVKHDNGLETLYGHLQAPLVTHGQKIYAGQPLGLGGATGNATGPHLHFETRLNGVAVDPANYFDFKKGGTTPRSGGAAPLRDDGGKKQSGKQKQQKQEQKATSKPARSQLRTETVASAAGTNAGTKPRTTAYKVRRGDTLEKIARDHGMSVGEICRINKMSKYTPMYTGKVIRLK